MIFHGKVVDHVLQYVHKKEFVSASTQLIHVQSQSALHTMLSPRSVSNLRNASDASLLHDHEEIMLGLDLDRSTSRSEDIIDGNTPISPLPMSPDHIEDTSMIQHDESFELDERGLQTDEHKYELLYNMTL